MLSGELHLARELLENYARHGKTLTYRDFASELDITEAPVIGKCTKILEELMTEDAGNNRPILSSIVVQQGRACIPRLGFYQQLSVLNLYRGDELGVEAAHWHQTELSKLKNFYTSYDSDCDLKRNEK